MNDKSTSRVERTQTRRYLIETVPTLLLTLAPMLVILTISSADRSDRLGKMLAVTSVIGALLFVLVIVRHVRRADEYQRRGLMTTFAIGFGATAVASFCVGLADLVAWEVPAGPWLVLGAGMTSWLLATIVLGRR